MAAAVLAAAFAYARSRVEGAADLAALAGGRSQAMGREACPAAEESARANGARITGCTVTGDEVEFVVEVSTALPVAWGPWDAQVQGRAWAGVVTGAPE
nr:Rv3654c family TadE-like protein [Propioniciclava soli]